MPFKIQMSSLDGRDMADTIEALESLLSNIPGQSDNICFQRLLAVLSDEWHRRRGADLPQQHEIALPLAEATNAHVWALLKFAGAVVVSAAQGEPSAMAQFFARVIDEIESVTQRVASAVTN